MLLTHDLVLLSRAAKSVSASHPAHPVGYNHLAGVSIGWILRLDIPLEGGWVNFPNFHRNLVKSLKSMFSHLFSMKIY